MPLRRPFTSSERQTSAARGVLVGRWQVGGRSAGPSDGRLAPAFGRSPSISRRQLTIINIMLQFQAI